MTAAAPLLAVTLWLALSPAAAVTVATDLDGSLVAEGALVRLQGTEMPPPQAVCAGSRGEWRCGRLAASALAARIGAGVACAAVDGEPATVRCAAGGDDLGTWLIAEGWARAAAGASAAQVAAEADARAARRGVWRSDIEPGTWRVDPEAAAGCDTCAARHERVTRTAAQPGS